MIKNYNIFVAPSVKEETDALLQSHGINVVLCPYPGVEDLLANPPVMLPTEYFYLGFQSAEEIVDPIVELLSGRPGVTIARDVATGIEPASMASTDATQEPSVETRLAYDTAVQIAKTKIAAFEASAISPEPIADDVPADAEPGLEPRVDEAGGDVPQ